MRRRSDFLCIAALALAVSGAAAIAAAEAQLPTIDPNGTLPEAHCHRVVRHALLWLFHEVTDRLSEADEDVAYSPGATSNPEPLEAIRGHPVIALDISFYLLADTDRALPEPTGYHLVFRDDLTGGPVLTSEMSEAIRDNHQAILTRDPTDIVRRLRQQGALAMMIETGEARRLGSDLFNPERGQVPLPVIDSDAPPTVYRGAEDYLLSFATAAAMSRAFYVIDRVVQEGLASADIVALHPLLQRMAGQMTDPPATDREGAAGALWCLRDDLSAKPKLLCWSSLWLLLHVESSHLRDGVEAPLIAWIFAAADHLVRHARFRLYSPATTAGPIEDLVAAPERSRATAARLLLALAPAAPTRLVSPVRERLELIGAGGM